MTYLNDKNIKYADLIVPFTGCPFDQVEDDCPFVKYWNSPKLEDRVLLIAKIPENELRELQDHHRKCVLNKKRFTQYEPNYIP